MTDTVPSLRAQCGTSFIVASCVRWVPDGPASFCAGTTTGIRSAAVPHNSDISRSMAIPLTRPDTAMQGIGARRSSPAGSLALRRRLR